MQSCSLDGWRRERRDLKARLRKAIPHPTGQQAELKRAMRVVRRFLDDKREMSLGECEEEAKKWVKAEAGTEANGVVEEL